LEHEQVRLLIAFAEAAEWPLHSKPHCVTVPLNKHSSRPLCVAVPAGPWQEPSAPDPRVDAERHQQQGAGDAAQAGLRQASGHPGAGVLHSFVLKECKIEAWGAATACCTTLYELGKQGFDRPLAIQTHAQLVLCIVAAALVACIWHINCRAAHICHRSSRLCTAKHTHSELHLCFSGGACTQALPIIMSGRDCIGIAKTGSGKTLAFVLPMLRHIKDQPPLANGDGPIALIMAPTRELVAQISKVRWHQLCIVRDDMLSSSCQRTLPLPCVTVLLR
jgi:hypothetical protein